MTGTGVSFGWRVKGIALLIVLALPRIGLATTLICQRETHSSSELSVQVPTSSHDAFVQLIESGEIVPVKTHLTYSGGIESDRVKTWGLHNSKYTIGVYVDFLKKSQEFVFWVQTCGTIESWRPYWCALTERAGKFPGAVLKERPLSAD